MTTNQRVYMGLDQAYRFAQLILNNDEIFIIRKSWNHLEAQMNGVKYDILFNEDKGAWEFQHNGTMMASLDIRRHF